MNFNNIKYAAIVLILCSVFFSGTAFAGIIEKESYSIQPKIKYKENLNIAILSFTGEISEERKYIKELIKNNLGDNILLYKKIRFPFAIIDFKTYAFNSSGKEMTKLEKPEHKNNAPEESNGRFLDLNLTEDKILTYDNKLNNVDFQEWIVPGTDIIITGVLKQDTNNLKIRVKVNNNIYGKTFNIEKEGTFKNIDQLLESLSHEVIKSILYQYSYLNVSCNEKDASIYIDDRYFGRTNKSGILLESGVHKVVISKDNYPEKTTIINIAEESTDAINIEFSPKDVYQKNSVNITTEPDKAKVYLDSKYIGLSPIVTNDLVNGITYRVRIEKEGYISKYQTIKIGSSKDSKTGNKNDFSFTLERGDSKEYYFSRTSAYNNLFICSSFGIVISSASYLYFGLKVNDEKARLDSMSITDSDYNSKKRRIDKYKLYQQISLYTAGAMIISAGVFYYLDKAQDDISIALYLPQKNYFMSNSFTNSPRSLFSPEKGVGIIFTKTF